MTEPQSRGEDGEASFPLRTSKSLPFSFSKDSLVAGAVEALTSCNARSQDFMGVVYMRACVAWNLASASDAQVKLQRVQTRSLTSPSNMSPGSDAPTDKCSAKAAHGTTAEAGSYEIPQAAQAFALLIATARLAACPSSSRCRGRTSQVLLDSGRFDGIICSLDEFRGCRH